MFLNNLNEIQQGKLLSLAKDIMHADGIIDEREQIIIETLRGQCFSNVEPQKAVISELVKDFSNQKDKVSLVLELMGVAYADESYHQTEKSLIHEISSALGLSPQIVEDMSAWVIRQFNLVKEAKIFMED